MISKITIIVDNGMPKMRIGCGVSFSLSNSSYILCLQIIFTQKFPILTWTKKFGPSTSNLEFEIWTYSKISQLDLEKNELNKNVESLCQACNI